MSAPTWEDVDALARLRGYRLTYEVAWSHVDSPAAFIVEISADNRAYRERCVGFDSIAPTAVKLLEMVNRIDQKEQAW